MIRDKRMGSRMKATSEEKKKKKERSRQVGYAIERNRMKENAQARRGGRDDGWGWGKREQKIPIQYGCGPSMFGIRST